MTEKVTCSSRVGKLRRLVAEERRLLQEKASLELMLKNVQQLRNKLKVEQIQLSSNLQVELGGDYIEVPVKSLPLSPDPLDMEEEEDNVLNNKPSLNLNVNDLPRMFFGMDDDAEENEEEDSEEEIGCANEVLGNFNETEINFDDF
ncbi:uncharacterized protein LOC113206654 [Frankliniella occidentalis]|uniref:Uncharacterized protein LOC113206654 n=1 Tax=Frankliniella occidentalis TaxID=133901 RepID=A0A6J1SJ69_FRAOC|nr:uncharacterized protein LOC113206654 [Frankliniella occidentalis]